MMYYFNILKKGIRFVNYKKRLPTIYELKNFIKTQTKFRTVMPLPSFGQIEITTKCNFNCTYCSRASLPKDLINKNMSFKKVKRIIDMTKFEYITFQGFGEPLLNNELEQMLSYAKSKSITTRIVTNGSLLPNINLLKNLDCMTISFDTTDIKIFENQRRGSNYKKIIQNISEIVKLKQKKEISTLIEFNVVVTHLNYSEIEKIVFLAKDLSIDKVVFNEVLNMSLESKDSYRKTQLFIFEARKLRNEIHKKIKVLQQKEKKIEIIPPISGDYDPKQFKRNCIWPFRGSFITINGYLTPCCVIMNPNIYNFGNIFEKNFEEVWNGKKFQVFRHQNLQGVTNICDRCPYIT